MVDQSDSELLLSYSANDAEQAFVELVRRHVEMVYSAALRVVRDRHLAEDVTQEVFVQLAQQAMKLSGHNVLAAWLHRTTRNISSQYVRTAVRRRRREQQHASMHEQASTSAELVWEEIAPSIDSLIDELNEADRIAVVYRYFQHKSAREMADILGTSAEAAQKRVSRAVEQLRTKYAQRGITLTSGQLSSVIAANAVHAVPVGMVATISAAAATASSVVATTLISTTKAVIMTSLQKILATSASSSLPVRLFIKPVRFISLRANLRPIRMIANKHRGQMAQIHGNHPARMKILRHTSGRPCAKGHLRTPQNPHSPHGSTEWTCSRPALN